MHPSRQYPASHETDPKHHLIHNTQHSPPKSSRIRHQRAMDLIVQLSILRRRIRAFPIWNKMKYLLQESANIGGSKRGKSLLLRFPLIKRVRFGRIIVCGDFQRGVTMAPRPAQKWYGSQFSNVYRVWGAMYEHLRVVPPGKRLRVPSCTRPDILGSG